MRTRSRLWNRATRKISALAAGASAGSIISLVCEISSLFRESKYFEIDWEADSTSVSSASHRVSTACATWIRLRWCRCVLTAQQKEQRAHIIRELRRIWKTASRHPGPAACSLLFCHTNARI